MQPELPVLGETKSGAKPHAGDTEEERRPARSPRMLQAEHRLRLFAI